MKKDRHFLDLLPFTVSCRIIICSNLKLCDWFLYEVSMHICKLQFRTKWERIIEKWNRFEWRNWCTKREKVDFKLSLYSSCSHSPLLSETLMHHIHKGEKTLAHILDNVQEICRANWYGNVLHLVHLEII